jgi:flagellar motor switch/type III secretory pathway protein FliN
MTPRSVMAYPWAALETIRRGSARGGARARKAVQAVLDLGRLGSALSDLTECEASLIVRSVSDREPRLRPLARLGLALSDSGVICALATEPEFAANVLSRVLRRPIALSSHAVLDDSLAGAFAAVVLEWARRSGAKSPIHLLDEQEAFGQAREIFVEATVLLAGTAYQVVVGLALPPFSASSPRSLAELGELQIAVPLVIGTSLAERAAVADFRHGNGWFPGEGLWIDGRGTGRVALAAGRHDRGVSGTLSPDGTIVIRGESVALSFEANDSTQDSPRDQPMKDSEGPDPARLLDTVLDSPVVVRVELGVVSMSAREWAELGPGDVIETGRRLAEPVILRVAGREVARGELVSLEGELGVRIRELTHS